MNTSGRRTLTFAGLGLLVLAEAGILLGSTPQVSRASSRDTLCLNLGCSPPPSECIFRFQKNCNAGPGLCVDQPCEPD